MAKMRKDLIGKGHPHIGSNRGIQIVSGAVEITDECQRPHGRKHRLLLYYRAWTQQDFIVLLNGSKMGRRAQSTTYLLRDVRERRAWNIVYFAAEFGIDLERLYMLIETNVPTKFTPFIPHVTAA